MKKWLDSKEFTDINTITFVTEYLDQLEEEEDQQKMLDFLEQGQLWLYSNEPVDLIPVGENNRNVIFFDTDDAHTTYDEIVDCLKDLQPNLDRRNFEISYTVDKGA